MKRDWRTGVLIVVGAGTGGALLYLFVLVIVNVFLKR